MALDNRGPITRSLEETSYWKQSPFIQGFMAGIKGGLLGGAAGAAVSGLRGKNAVTGMLLGGIGTGLAAGLTAAAAKEVENTNTEAALRYHVMRLGEREPMIYMPPPKVFGPLFSKMHSMVHRRESEGGNVY